MAENTNDISKLSERITELESRLAFQDQIVDDLNEVIFRLQGQIDDLTAELARLQRRMQGLAPEEGEQASGHE